MIKKFLKDVVGMLIFAFKPSKEAAGFLGKSLMNMGCVMVTGGTFTLTINGTIILGSSGLVVVIAGLYAVAIGFAIFNSSTKS